MNHADPNAQHGPPGQEHQAPEAVRLLFGCWVSVVAMEVLHQVLNFVFVVIDPATMRAAAVESLESTDRAADFPPGMVDLAVYVSAGFTALVGVAVQAILAWAAWMVLRRHRWADGSRRLLMFFGFYLVIRTVVIFGMSIGATDVPVALIAFDGAVQVLAGVVAAVSLVFVFRSETVRWAGQAAAERDRAWTDPGPGGR